LQSRHQRIDSDDGHKEKKAEEKRPDQLSEYVSV